MMRGLMNFYFIIYTYIDVLGKDLYRVECFNFADFRQNPISPLLFRQLKRGSNIFYEPL